VAIEPTVGIGMDVRKRRVIGERSELVLLNAVKEGQEICVNSREDESSHIWKFETLGFQSASIADPSLIGMIVDYAYWSQNER
jgi:hypothetical protein